ncbi:Nucleoside 5-triphosphatase RdgB (dHAPTP, dITP, XTP-specific) [Fulvivirga imtechensis AK7]|uniref:dITP/XTP pyrophosphatase n=1 Tax=Fulvivirga imtechensis AK7 TaxID=1237149 RepID=L8JQ00_9BACT|nr:non-canonical purine NTP diphosphatase [Fulvivirga imtechensis]ELR70920.1 Nucleoside 5-triphosphatase RdgB (dHAPTP, dITP, XTP-specific) [Fulvivirga imtechensis AK7]
MKICFATNNVNKLNEIQQLLPEGLTLVSLQEIGCTEELREDQLTLEGNSHQKAEYVFQKYNIPCFADDTGLEVFALDGEPGVYSARYAGEGRNNEDNISLLLKKLESFDNRGAQFRTVITLIAEGNIKQFEGVVKGEVIREKAGGDGFGYDPVFKPEGYDKTFAQMTMAEKNEISHRGIAVRKLVDYISTHYKS